MKRVLYLFLLLFTFSINYGLNNSSYLKSNSSNIINNIMNNNPINNIINIITNYTTTELLPVILIIILLIAISIYFTIQNRKIKNKKEIDKKENIIKKIKSEEKKNMNSKTSNSNEIILKENNPYGISHKGNRAHNEDYILLKKIKDIYLLAVADGIGGHNAGEIASEMAINTLENFIKERYREDLSTEETKKILREAYNLAHKKIKENAVGDRKGMGTTLTTAVIKGDKCIIANCGDSRAYLIRDGDIIHRTKDHSFVQALIDSGQISEEKAMTHPMKNIITSALGLDEFNVDDYLWDLKKEDILLLSSDGLHDYVSKEDILKIVNNNEDPKNIVNELFNIALEKTKDNVSIVVYKKH